MDEKLKRLIELMKNLMELGQRMLGLNQEFQKSLEKAKPEELRNLAGVFSKRLDALSAEQQKATEESLGLAQQLASQPPAPEVVPIRAEDVARQFRNLVDSIQLDARKPSLQQSATILKSLDVELKGLIVVDKDEARVVTPTPGRPVDPGQLSTIRMSFGAVPVLPSKVNESPDGPQ